MNELPKNSCGWRSEDFALQESSTLGLDMSIRIVADGLYFLATPHDRQAPLGEQATSLKGCSYAFVPFQTPGVEGVKEAFFAHEWLAYPYKRTFLYVDDASSYTLIPKDLLFVAEPMQWLANVTRVEGKQVLSLELTDEHIHLAYGMDADVYEFCSRSFSYPQFRHSVASFIPYATTLSRLKHPRLTLVVLEGEIMDVIHVKDGGVILVNRYQVHSDVDKLYYITALWRLLDLDPEQDPLYFYATSGAEVEALNRLLKDRIATIYTQEYPTHSLPSSIIGGSTPLPPAIILDQLCE